MRLYEKSLLRVGIFFGPIIRIPKFLFMDTRSGAKIFPRDSMGCLHLPFTISHVDVFSSLVIDLEKSHYII